MAVVPFDPCKRGELKDTGGDADQASQKPRAPKTITAESGPRRLRQNQPTAAFAELAAISNFSFLEGASHADEMVAQARALGLSAIAIADRNSLAGVVRAHTAAKQADIRCLVGARIVIDGWPEMVWLPTDRDAYGRLSQMLSDGQMRAEKGACSLGLADLEAACPGNVILICPPDDWQPHSDPSLAATLEQLRGMLAKAHDCYMLVARTYCGRDRVRLKALATLAEQQRLPLVASNKPAYHGPHRKPLADVLTCIREKTTIDRAGYLIDANAERHLKSSREMLRLFRGYEQALNNSLKIANDCQFSLDELAYEYPEEPVPDGRDPQSHLETLVRDGARWRFPDGVPETVAVTIDKELSLIARLDYARYFLTVHDIVNFARGQGILCQGRGSAANSVICYCLGITAVNPVEVNLLFERFISEERKEPPDIDVDFEHARREEVIQYIYARYGRQRAGLVATVISYRARSAVREIGKAMGLSEDVVAALAGMVWGTRSGGALPETHIREAGLDPNDPLISTVVELTEEMIGFPRHLSQHVGGFVLTRGPLTEVVPIGNGGMADRTFIEWDKDDIEALGLLKIDVLALGMLTCIHKAFDLVGAHHDRNLNLATV
ncbi:MAG: PHP domain-containing protein, partial [Pseudomonadota bacterium]